MLLNNDEMPPSRRDILRTGLLCTGLGLTGCLRLGAGDNDATSTAAPSDGAAPGATATSRPTDTPGGEPAPTETPPEETEVPEDTPADDTETPAEETPAETETPAEETPEETETPTDEPDCPTTVDSVISSDTTWGSTCEQVRLASSITVTEGATLTVEPGTEVIATSGTRLTVDGGGALKARGTADQPITFRGASRVPGYWTGLYIDANTRNELDYVTVTDAGKQNYSDRANVYVTSGSRLSVTNSTIGNSNQEGMYVSRRATVPAFENNTFQNNGSEPLVVPANLIGSLDGGSRYDADNGENRIRVLKKANVTTDQEWPAAGVPYYFEPRNGADSPVKIEASVSILPGASFQFGSDAHVAVTSGTLTAAGTADRQITFEGERNTQGFWLGLEFQSAAGNELDYVTVSNGGASSLANVYLQSGSQVTVTNSTLTDSATYGIAAEQESTLETRNNSYENNAEGDVRRDVPKLGL